ncbi:MAG: DUF1232 domain-containing protein [Ignavibacteriaceae bacterium]
MNPEEKDFYKKIRKKISNWLESNAVKNKQWSEYILLAPDLFHLLTKLSIDKEIPESKKVKLYAAIAYFISPIDLLPEALLGPVGFLDDIALSAYILNDIINNVDPKIVTRNWAGDRDILTLVKTIIANANNFLGSGMLKKIKKRI